MSNPNRKHSAAAAAGKGPRAGSIEISVALDEDTGFTLEPLPLVKVAQFCDASERESPAGCPSDEFLAVRQTLIGWLREAEPPEESRHTAFVLLFGHPIFGEFLRECMRTLAPRDPLRPVRLIWKITATHWGDKFAFGNIHVAQLPDLTQQ